MSNPQSFSARAKPFMSLSTDEETSQQSSRLPISTAWKHLQLYPAARHVLQQRCSPTQQILAPPSPLSDVASPPSAQTPTPTSGEEQDDYKNLSEAVVVTVENYPCVWNTKLRSYKDINMKEQAWKEIGSKIGVPIDKIKCEWGKLRENYRKCLRKREYKLRSGAGGGKLPSCSFFEQLSFLRDTLVNREAESNIVIPNERNSQDHETQNVMEFNPPSVKKWKSEEASKLSIMDTALVQTLQRVNRPKEAKDADELFCLSLVDSLKALPKQKNALAKIKIQQVLYELQFEN